MRKPFVVAVCILLLGACAVAQGKVDTKWHCNKPTTQYKFDVGDMPDHTYNLVQGTCTATASDSGFAEKTGQYTEFEEIWKDHMNFHGRYNVTMDNGDKVFYTYEGSDPTDITKPANNKWKMVSGTGKYKGIKGTGTCTGTRNQDESSEYTCTGTYSMAK